jgi:nucleotide-binding universal stress UspA family protein
MRTQYPPLPGGPPEGAVVVGVGLDGAEAAIAFAAEEACLTDRPLHLLHVLRVSAAEAYAAVYDGAVEAADQALTRSLAVARERVAGRVPVTAERVDDGWLVADLVQRTERAHLLVLQHRRLSRWQRLVAGSTVSGTAARARVPVVSVPEDWTPPVEVPAVVTVGVQEPVEAGPLVRQALELARERDARVVVLHAWWLNGGYDSVVNDPQFRAEQEREAVASLRPAL